MYRRRRQSGNHLLICIAVGGVSASIVAIVLLAVLGGKESNDATNEPTKGKEVAKADPEPVKPATDRKDRPKVKAPSAPKAEPKPKSEPNPAKTEPKMEAPAPIPALPKPKSDGPMLKGPIIIVQPGLGTFELDPFGGGGIRIKPDESQPPDEERPVKTTATPKVEQGKEIPIPGKLLKEIVVGYETRQMQGFTVLLSTHAVREAKKVGGKPFQALIDEFDGLIKVLPAHSLSIFRRTPIWIEWDNIDRRNPRTLAKYYSAGVWDLPEDEHPLKATSVEVLSLKRLAQQKANANQKPQIILLHELAHMIHHRVVGFEYADLLFAYKQAMDRRLYDKVKHDDGDEVRAYAATNELEYFAELSCAYLDRCPYYPFTRDELREYDPAGYRVMEKVWGKPKMAPKK